MELVSPIHKKAIPTEFTFSKVVGLGSLGGCYLVILQLVELGTRNAEIGVSSSCSSKLLLLMAFGFMVE